MICKCFYFIIFAVIQNEFCIFSHRGYSGVFCRLRGFGRGQRNAVRRSGRILRHLYSVNSRTANPDSSLMHTLLCCLRFSEYIKFILYRPLFFVGANELFSSLCHEFWRSRVLFPTNKNPYIFFLASFECPSFPFRSENNFISIARQMNRWRAVDSITGMWKCKFISS